MEETKRMKDEFELKMADLKRKQDEFDRRQAEFRANEMNLYRETKDSKALLKDQEEKIKKEAAAVMRKEEKLNKLKADVERMIEDFQRKRDKENSAKETDPMSLSKSNRKVKNKDKYLPSQLYAELMGKKMGYCWKFWDGVQCRCDQEKDGFKHECYNCERYHPTSQCPDKPHDDSCMDKLKTKSDFPIDDESTACC